MKRTLSALCIVLLVASAAGFAHEKHKRTLEDKQAGIDQMAENTHCHSRRQRLLS